MKHQINENFEQKINMKIELGAVHKGCPKSRHFADKGGVFQMRTSAILCPKKFGFFEIYGVSARTKGIWEGG